MTAKEILQDIVKEIAISKTKGFTPEWEEYKNKEMIYWRKRIKQLLKQVCKEQSIECGRIYEFESMDTDAGMYPSFRESIENAQMPEL